MQGGVFSGGGGGGGGGSTSSSTVSREDNVAMSSEGSSTPDETELELGLGLSLGRGFKCRGEAKARFARILTAKDLPSGASAAACCSSAASSSGSSNSSCSSTLSRANNGASGTKRTAADSSSPSPVVGWPPIRAYRINSMVNQTKSIASEEFNSMIEKNNSKKTMVEKTKNGSNTNNGDVKIRSSLFVKVNLDGITIGRKVDLGAHGCYETLAQTLEDMFLRPTATINLPRSSAPEKSIVIDATSRSKLLHGSSEYVLTYKDKEGDWMLVGDVPWGMFLSSVKRLRIMRTSEATGLAPRLQESNGTRRSKPI